MTTRWQCKEGNGFSYIWLCFLIWLDTSVGCDMVLSWDVLLLFGRTNSLAHKNLMLPFGEKKNKKKNKIASEIKATFCFQRPMWRTAKGRASDMKAWLHEPYNMSAVGLPYGIFQGWKQPLAMLLMCRMPVKNYRLEKERMKERS